MVCRSDSRESTGCRMGADEICLSNERSIPWATLSEVEVDSTPVGDGDCVAVHWPDRWRWS